MSQREPQEPCPFCGRKLEFIEDGWPWWQCSHSNRVDNLHVFAGPDNDYTGSKVDRLIRRMKRRIIQEWENAQ